MKALPITPSDKFKRIREIIEICEQRCLAADGPVTNTRDEMTDEELREIYILAGGLINCRSARRRK